MGAVHAPQVERLSPPKSSKGKHFVSGLASGIGSAVILQPLDLIKTRVQQPDRPSIGSSFKATLGSHHGKHNVWALWRGTTPSALRTGFGSALYFMLLNTLRQNALRFARFRDNAACDLRTSQLPALSNTANLFTGATARVLAGLVLMPLTVIKVRFESNMYSYKTIGGAARDIYTSGGFRGFFSGFGPTAIRDGPYAGMYVLFYESLKKRLSQASMFREVPSEQLAFTGTKGGAIVNFSSALLAGSICSIISNPFDAIKTRIQLQPGDYTNMAQALRKMVVGEGFRSLFDGLGLRMARKALSSALAWTLYEELIRVRWQ